MNKKHYPAGLVLGLMSCLATGAMATDGTAVNGSGLAVTRPGTPVPAADQKAHTVKVSVIDDHGEPITGASVVVKMC